jgi:hypothetical protein
MSRGCVETRQPRTVGPALRSVPLVELSGPRIVSKGNSKEPQLISLALSQGAKRYRVRTRSETWGGSCKWPLITALKNPYSPGHCIEPKLRCGVGPGGMPGEVSRTEYNRAGHGRLARRLAEAIA